MKTVNGIYLDIKESDYTLDVGCYKLYFSSEVYKNKFEKTYENYIREETYKLKTKYNISIDCFVMFLFIYYKKIEKRGFRIYDVRFKKYINKDIMYNVDFISF